MTPRREVTDAQRASARAHNPSRVGLAVVDEEDAKVEYCCRRCPPPLVRWGREIAVI